MHESSTLTGIPVDALLSVIGVLVGAIYADLKRDLRGLKRAAEKRDEHQHRMAQRQSRIAVVLEILCKTLKVPFSDVLRDADDSDHE
jgi:uncharacterized protein (DUF2384 family)